MITHAEKRFKNGKDYLVVVWDEENGKLHQEIFEIKKVREKDFFDIAGEECVVAGKQFIDIELQHTDLSNGPA